MGFSVFALAAMVSAAKTAADRADTSATIVLGQPDFGHNMPDCGPAGLSGPGRTTADAAGHLYVVDSGNNRVVGWSNVAGLNGGAPVDLVIGQPNPLSNSAAATQTGLNFSCEFAGGLSVDSSGNLYVADACNNRVLEFDAPFRSGLTAGQPAHLVFGQGNFTDHGCNAGAGGLCHPDAVATDTGGNLYVADTGNNRVLEYHTPLALTAAAGSGDTVADQVFGQDGDFGAASCNGGDTVGAARGSLCLPSGLTVDSAGNLYIADTGNNRVLEYDNQLANAVSPNATAGVVFGQNGSFISSACNDDENAGPANSLGPGDLCSPTAVAVDSGDDLYVADTLNNRVLEFASPLANRASPNTTANLVFGQGGVFDTRACGAGADGLCGPAGVVLDDAGNLYISDTANNRVLRFDRSSVSIASNANAVTRAALTPRATPTPTPAAVMMGPSSLAFPSQILGIPSQPQKITVFNAQRRPLRVSGIAITSIQGAAMASQFTERDTCGINPPGSATIPASGHCFINVTFTPNALGLQSASLSLISDFAGAPPSVSLLGVGAQSPAPGPTSTGSDTTAPTITITSPAPIAYSLNQVVKASYSCTDPDDPVASCVGPVLNGGLVDTFSLGTKAFIVDATDSHGNRAFNGVNYLVVDSTPPTITITSPTNTIYSLNQAVRAAYSCADPDDPVAMCSGTVPNGSDIDTASPGNKTFTVNAMDNQGVASSSNVTYAVGDLTAPTITITTPANDIYGLNQVVNADYQCTDPDDAVTSCVGTVADGTPIDTSSLGMKSFMVTATDSNGHMSSQTVSYTIVAFSPTSLDFGAQLIGARGPTKTVTVMNVESTPQTISHISAGGDFRWHNHCPSVLAKGASCTISVRFAPRRTGTQVSSLTILEGMLPLDVRLRGIGTRVTLSPAGLKFPGRPVGKKSAAANVTLANMKNSSLKISGVVVTGDFVAANGCGHLLPANSSCTISVRFAPTDVGKRVGVLSVNASSPTAPQSVSLSGLGLAAE